MEVIVDRCAGLDVHKRTVVAAVRTLGTGRRKRDTVVRTFSTFDDDLEALARWMVGLGVTQVAMEATGVYWKPVWQVLDDGDRFDEVLLVNPQVESCRRSGVPERVSESKVVIQIAVLLQGRDGRPGAERRAADRPESSRLDEIA